MFKPVKPHSAPAPLLGHCANPVCPNQSDADDVLCPYCQDLYDMEAE